MQDMNLGFAQPNSAGESGPTLRAGSLLLPLKLVRNRRARRYVLRLTREGAARVTVPHGGSVAGAVAFATQHAAWIERQARLQEARKTEPRAWTNGTELWFRGERHQIQVTPENGPSLALFADQYVRVADSARDMRAEIERHLWQLAAIELPARVHALAVPYGFRFQRVSVRNQRSRWGSCSRRGIISLNWRLVQTPPAIRDYIILHELAHLREMNHSPRFWDQVRSLCPGYLEAEEWLKKHGRLRD